MRAPLHRGVGQPHGELGRDVVLQAATHLFDDGEALVIGDPDPSVVLGLDAGAGQRLVVLRTRAEYQDQADPKRLQQGDIADDIGKVGVADGFPAHHQHEGGTPVHVDIGGGLPKGMDQAGFAFTHVFHSIKKQQFAQYMKINSQIKTKYWFCCFVPPF